MSRDLLVFASDPAAARKQIKAVRGEVTQSFGDRVWVVRLPRGTSLSSVPAVTTRIPADLDEGIRLMVKAWKSRGKKSDPAKVRRIEGRKWDTPGLEAPG